MSTSKEYLQYILGQLSELEEVTSRAMMGEYLLYYRGRLAGGIYDNRLLVKPVSAAVRLLPDAPLESPYPGAKPMLLIADTEDRETLAQLFTEMYDELPKKRK